MTGYHISLGYNGAIHNGYDTYDEMWEVLKRKTREICDRPQAIIAETRSLGNAPETCDDGCCNLDTYADFYAKSFSAYGHPITIIESGEEENRQIMQLASTGDDIKYCVRRAFVRLLIEAMHKEKIEVSVSVA